MQLTKYKIVEEIKMYYILLKDLLNRSWNSQLENLDDQFPETVADEMGSEQCNDVNERCKLKP